MKRSVVDIPTGSRAPELVNAIVEIPKGSRTKYEYDEESGLIRVDRVLTSALRYPANYGFVPRTRGDDGDPLDILILGQDPIAPLSLLTARPLAVLRMEEADGERDAKIVAVHADDPHYGPYRRPAELPPHVIPEIEQFFKDYKILEGKPVKIKGFEGVTQARAEIERACRAYRRKPCRRRPPRAR